MADNVDALVASLGSARTTLSELPVRGPRHFFLRAMAGYLWSAIAVGDTLLAVARSQAGRGAGPLTRFLHETYLDVMFLVTDPDGDLLAAKTILLELRDSRTLVSEYREVRAAHPDANLPPVPPDWEYFDRPIEEAVGVLNAENIVYGGSADLFTRAWSSWETSKYWHWSGLTRKKMIDALLTRGKLDGRSAFMAMSLTKIYNASAHPTPAWGDLPFPEDGASIDLPDLSSERDLSQVALAGQQFLDGIAREVQAGFATVSAA